ncbi:MAG: hypothetical protein ABL963_11580 [Longimicrobiales bacterium]
MMRGRAKFTGTWVVVGALMAACAPTPEELEQQQQLAELPTVLAEKARLQGEVTRLQAEMSQIEAELSRLTMIRAPASQEAERPSAPATVGQLVAHVSEVEEQLTAAQTRLRSVNATSATQVQRIAVLESSIAEEQAALEGQRQRVASLEAAISGLEAETARQGELNERLVQTVEEMTDDANTVWYVVGTKEELLERGVIREEGGSRVLFIFGKRGKTLVPSRTPDRSMFTAADLRTVRSIALPDEEADATWMVVSPQDLAAVGSPLDERGRVVGDALSIVDPQQFWANSRYLIVVRS